MLAILLVVYAFSGVDRAALMLLQQDIKADLALSDSQVGVLSGIAFSLFYAIMGLPLARWADRGNRVSIIAITCLLWGVAVISCGVAGGFLMLLLSRVGAAVGQAGCIPPAHSLIADYFPRAERPRAIATYCVGGSLSVLIAYPLAGRLNEAFGWRSTFVLLGTPSVVLAALVWFTLKEPRVANPVITVADGLAEPSAATRPAGTQIVANPSFGSACGLLWRNATFRQLLFAYAVLGVCDSGIWSWMPTFFIRSYGLRSAEVGTWFGPILGLTGMLGTFAGGALASRYAANNERLQLKVTSILFCTFGAVTASLLLTSNLYVAFALMAIAIAGVCAIGGPLFSTVQTLVPQHMRALAVAILYLFNNLIGAGLGPLGAGVLSDALRPAVGEESLRYALLALCPVYLWGTWHLWLASRTVIRDLGVIHEDRKGAAVASVSW